MLEISQTAPSFCLPNLDNAEICLRDFKGKWIVLYFYPKDSTPGCTTEACEFTQSLPNFEKLDSVIIGISPDSPKKHANFIAKNDLKIILLSDEDKKVCEDYNVWQLKKMCGKEYMGVVRSTFLINPEGKITKIWSNVKVKGHVQEVQKTLSELKA